LDIRMRMLLQLLPRFVFLFVFIIFQNFDFLKLCLFFQMHWSHHLSTCYRSTILLTLFSVFVLIIAYITRDVPPYRPSI
jgi:hypothetical protein